MCQEVDVGWTTLSCPWSTSMYIVHPASAAHIRDGDQAAVPIAAAGMLRRYRSY